MSKYKNVLKKNKITSVQSKIAGRDKDMASNNGGGVTFTLGKWEVLSRFLNLGAESGTFYLSASKHQYNNYDNIIECINEDGIRVVDTLSEVSDKGLAHKNDHAIFALALCFSYGDDETKSAASLSLDKVCRTGTHILMFVQFIKELRGFGKVVRNAINNWYLSKSNKDFAFQVSKYQNRDGWSHRDVFCLTHPNFGNGDKNNIARWSMNLSNRVDLSSDDSGVQLLAAIDRVKTLSSKTEIMFLINEYNLQREHLPTELLNDPTIQEFLLPNLGSTALIRNLGNMSKSGLIKPLSKESKFVISKLENTNFLKKGRVHPLSLYIAKKTYERGTGFKGSGSWNPDSNVVDALESAFYNSFDLVEPTRKNYFFGIDISGSMTSSISSSPIVSCHEVATIIALTMAKVEPYTFVGGFSHSFVDLKISKKDNLQSALEKTNNSSFGGTNPGAAIEYAIKHKIDTDVFVFITDNEVNSGSHPSQYLKQYRKVMNKPNCKMIVIGLTATKFTIADPKDPLMLDIAGFSPDITSIISNFVSA
jgi:60 kDa SS-A/Ro ribonucleoprotein